MNVQEVPINKVKPYEKNPRKKKNIEKVANSIKEFGFLQPIVVDQNMVIVVGHGRYEAAKMLDLKNVPVLKIGVGTVESLSPAQIKAYRIADNKLNEYSEWDFGLLHKEFSDLLDINYDLEHLGFGDHELESMITFEGNTDLYTADDAKKEWLEMPEFDHDNKKPYRTIYVHFYKEEEVQQFSKVINQPITDKTKFLYVPPIEKKIMKDKEYDNE
jgi:ParB family chromosome partitioning protein